MLEVISYSFQTNNFYNSFFNEFPNEKGCYFRRGWGENKKMQLNKYRYLIVIFINSNIRIDHDQFAAANIFDRYYSN